MKLELHIVRFAENQPFVYLEVKLPLSICTLRVCIVFSDRGAYKAFHGTILSTHLA